MVSHGAKELACKISSKSGVKHGSYGTRGSSGIRDKEQKTQNGPNQKFFFSKLIEKYETKKYGKRKRESLCKNFLFAFLIT